MALNASCSAHMSTLAWNVVRGLWTSAHDGEHNALKKRWAAEWMAANGHRVPACLAGWAGSAIASSSSSTHNTRNDGAGVSLRGGAHTPVAGAKLHDLNFNFKILVVEDQNSSNAYPWQFLVEEGNKIDRCVLGEEFWTTHGPTHSFVVAR